jgi:8-oxo-dGTP diphosphatase
MGPLYVSCLGPLAGAALVVPEARQTAEREVDRGIRGAALSSAGMGVTLIVDGANVMGSRADGWWRDRAGAMARLHGELAALATRGIPGPVPGDSDAGEPWFPQVVLVVEGRARAVLDLVSDAPGVRVVAALGEGDDEIAGLAGELPGRRIVVTADRELRRRSEAAGAAVVGPRWLTRLLA